METAKHILEDFGVKYHDNKISLLVEILNKTILSSAFEALINSGYTFYISLNLLIIVKK